MCFLLKILKKSTLFSISSSRNLPSEFRFSEIIAIPMSWNIFSLQTVHPFFINTKNVCPYTLTVQLTNAVTCSTEHLFIHFISEIHYFQEDRNYPPKLFRFTFLCLMLQSCAAKFKTRNCHVAQYLCLVQDCTEDYDKVSKENILKNNNLFGYILQKYTWLQHFYISPFAFKH